VDWYGTCRHHLHAADRRQDASQDVRVPALGGEDPLTLPRLVWQRRRSAHRHHHPAAIIAATGSRAPPRGSARRVLRCRSRAAADGAGVADAV